MCRFIKSLFGKKGSNNRFLANTSDFNFRISQIETEIPTLTFDKSKKNILLLDDNLGSVSFLEDDLHILNQLAKNLRGEQGIPLRPRSINFFNLLSPKEKEFIMQFRIGDYDILKATGDKAGFTVLEALSRGLKPIVSVLDIVLGGVVIINKRPTTCDGIDVAKVIWQNQHNAKIAFYSGCASGKYCPEQVKFRNLFKGQELTDYLILKDPDIHNRRLRLLRLLKDAEQF